MVFHLLSFIYFVDNQTEQNYYLTGGKKGWSHPMKALDSIILIELGVEY